MSKPYWSGPSTLSGPTDHNGYDTGVTDAYQAADGGADEVEDYDAYEDAYESYGHRDTRWRWVAGLAAVVLLVAVVATVAVVKGGDSVTTSATPTNRAPLSAQDEAPTTTPRTVIATVPPSVPPAPAPLAPETVVTVTTTPSAAAQAPVPVEVAPGTRTITYSVTGSRQLFDLISVIYTDEQGFPHPEVNVALPWSKTVVLNPGVDIKSVTATSVGGQLNCTITDAAGATIVAQTNNTMITTCTS